MADEAARQDLKITGMTCGGCVQSVSRLLSRVEGVDGVEVDLASGEAHVRGTASFEQLAQAVRGAGYGAEPL